MSNFDLPLGGGQREPCECRKHKSEGAGFDYSALAPFLPLLTGGKNDPLLDALIPLVGKKNLDLQALLPLLPLLIEKRNKAPSKNVSVEPPSKERLVNIEDYRRVG